MVTVPRWKIPVQDRDGHLSQLGVTPERDGRVTFLPPSGDPYQMTRSQLEAAHEQLGGILRAMHGAEFAREVGRLRVVREGC